MLTLPRHKAGWLPFLVFILVLAGCPGGGQEPERAPLLSCGDRVVTAGEYQDALQLALQGYPYQSLSSKEDVAAIRRGVLHQLQEELLILRFADDEGIALTEAELDAAIRGAREGYPEGAFERELVSHGISMEVWTRRIEKRLLAEKVLATEFGREIHLSYADFQSIREEAGTGLSENGLVQKVKQSRKEAAYRRWRRGVGEKYSIEVNADLWEKILEGDRL